MKRFVLILLILGLAQICITKQINASAIDQINQYADNINCADVIENGKKIYISNCICISTSTLMHANCKAYPYRLDTSWPSSNDIVDMDFIAIILPHTLTYKVFWMIGSAALTYAGYHTMDVNRNNNDMVVGASGALLSVCGVSGIIIDIIRF